MSDYIVRATAADGQIRAFAANTKDVVETARKDHNTSPVATAALGRLLPDFLSVKTPQKFCGIESHRPYTTFFISLFFFTDSFIVYNASSVTSNTISTYPSAPFRIAVTLIF